MNREEYLKKCAEYILDLEKKVKVLNSLNYYDINISCENFYARLLKLVYGWNLENMNYKENNAKAIDLYDKDSRIAVQVTSDDSANKIHNTIQKFIEKELQNNYDRLIFVVITANKTYRANFDTKTKFDFDKKQDIITCAKLINDIKELTTEKVVEIYKYLAFEFDSVMNNDFVWTIEQAEEYMSSNTNGVLSLDYFEIDDNEFIEKFDLAFDEGGNVFVKGVSREETLYCVLNLLKKKNVKKAIHIIKNKDSWIEFSKYIQDAILIPYFQDEEIAGIKGNINIFIYGIENNTIKNCISLRRRKIRTLVEKLKDYKAGNHSLVVKTNGLFPFIKKHLFDGHIDELPYKSTASKAVIAGLLIGQWTETEGDKCIIEKISGMAYNIFFEEIKKYMNVETPLFIKTTSWGGNTYRISDAMIFWSKYYKDITVDDKNAFYELTENVILDKDPLFNLPFKEHMYGSIKAGKSKYSNAMKKGMLQSLVFFAINGEQVKVDNCIRKILSGISDLNMWGYIAQFAEHICEASPAMFIEKIETSKDENEFIALFKSEDRSFTARHYYTHILWALEMLLRVKEYAARVVRLLMCLTVKIQKCAISNSPSEVLSVVFCDLLNLYSISFEEKIKLAEIGVKQYETMWEIIYNVLKFRERAIMVSRPTFEYRLSDDETAVTYEESSKVCVGYVGILRKYIGNDASKWVKMIELFAKMSDGIFAELFEQFEKDVEKFGDVDKEFIKTKLRKVIYQHRFYCNSDWAMDEDRIGKMEKVCKNIKFDNPAYDFVYLIGSKYELPLYNPKPIDNNGRDKNKELKEKLLREEFNRIKSGETDICEVIALRCSNGYTQFGSYIAKYYSEGVFDEELYKSLLKIRNIRHIIIDYVAYTYSTDNNILSIALELGKDYENSNDLYVGILKIPEITGEYIEFICKQDTDVQKKYFSNQYLSLEKRPAWGDIFIQKCIEYDCACSLLNFLYSTKNEFTVDEIIELLFKLLKMPTQNEQLWNETYLLEEIIKYIQSLIKDDFDKYDEMCTLEMMCYKVISWEGMMCTQYLFKTDASLYAQLIEMVFSKEGEVENEMSKKDDEQKIREYWWTIYYNAKFCPGEIDGNIEVNILEKWIDDFENLLKGQQQSSLFTHIIGTLFAHSPIGNDGHYPNERIRDIIEQRMDDSLKQAYVSAELNKRGVHTVDAGEGEKKLALKYKKNADSLRIEYPKTAEIYDELSKNYSTDAIIEREIAEDGRW